MATNDMQWPQPGLGSVGSYQMSGIPFLTASLTVPINSSAPLKIEFPSVTKFVTVASTNGAVKFGFSQNGVSGSGTNFYTLAASSSYTGEWRVEDIFLISPNGSQASASIIAGLTGIARGIPAVVGSGNNWSGSSGVG